MIKHILSIALCCAFSLISFAQTAVLAGTINTSNGDPVGQVTVRLEDQSGALLSVTTTNISGTYSFPGLNTGNIYRVVPQKDLNPLNGVSTFDIVLVAKHILGLDPITDPYNIIAADVNGSNTVTTFDIVTSRRLILGMDPAYIIPSWRFWPATTTFSNPMDPFSGISGNNAEILLTQDETNFDFIGVKTGDVNHTNTPNN